MSARDQYRPRFTEEDALRIAEKLFGIAGSVKELPSERDRNFFLRTDSGDEFVLKIAATSEKREILEFQNQAMDHLVKKGDKEICPNIIESLAGEQISVIEVADGTPSFVRLLNYLPGKVLAKVKPHSENLLYGLGAFIGSLSRALEGFSHPATDRELYWDLKNASSTINRYKEQIKTPERVAIVEECLEAFNTQVVPVLPHLRTSVIHNDGNDNNILVRFAGPPEEHRFSILDFGDMVFSHTIFELAVAVTYAILGKSDPIATAAQVVRGYHSVFPLTAQEVELLFLLIRTRLAMSVSISAYQQKLEPDNEYLIISEKDAWETLYRLRAVHPRFVTCALRQVCNLPPCPQSETITKWLIKNQKQIGPLIKTDLQTESVDVFDLSVGSLECGSLPEIQDTTLLTKFVTDRIGEAGDKVGIGRYNEPRLTNITKRKMHAQYDIAETPTIHLGMDLFLTPGEPILAPLDGIIHSLANNQGFRENGPTLILEHKARDTNLKFYTMYSHLSKESLEGLAPGKPVKKGNQIGQVGTPPENGDWPVSFHFQLMCDIFDMQGDFPSYALPSQRELWLSICPDPNIILGIPVNRLSKNPMSVDEILAARNTLIGKPVSVSYQTPLKIVRGYMQYLYDEEGCAYLDARNNVSHVGHSHPKVVKALHEQATVLNTNTRYVHENLIKYAQRLVATLPDPLSVCFFVNSGSEANELALRLARTHTNQSDIIVIEGAYHGNTSTLIDISPYKFNGPGGKGSPPFVHTVSTPDGYRGKFRGLDSKAGKKYAAEVLEITKTLKKAGKGVAAFVCEPIMGAAGQIVFPNKYLQEAFRHIRQAGGVCIIDEVQTGFGRMGTHFWAFETQDIIPDIITLGKPIGNGHPLAAVVTTPDIAESFDTGMEFFSSTGGNPVSCAVGLTVLDIIEEERLQENALKIGTYFIDQLKQLQSHYPLIGDIRGRGLFIGVELVLTPTTREPATKETVYIIERMKDLGILISSDGPFNNVLKIKPPMVFTQENVDFFIRRFETILSEDFVNPELE
ncbi:MAG: aminotransferase class III-fold pyridoxal phosphate-dependent enzyme [Candidatus Hermodarchaeota archaeon]|nr:aminotransferase class III-fold pyridoxal phosphate-dependent enzyme [Candidatus Hermodarchaeota archaeon]